jgi:hypothetical protein
MKKSILLILALFLSQATHAQDLEQPNFSFLFHGDVNGSGGFFQGYQPGFGGGIWFGTGFSDRFDGLWAIDYLSLPGEAVTLSLPSPSQPVSTRLIRPTDDLSLTVNTRWYWSDKWDHARQRFNTVPYFVGGLGMDLILDQYDRPPGTSFFNTEMDFLFAVNLGVGLDMPLGDGKQWLLYAEGLDHLIFWQGLTHVVTLRGGLKVALDSAHLDPFR